MATKKITIRDLCLQQDPRMYSDPEPSYEFQGRKFTKPQQTNRVSNEK